MALRCGIVAACVLAVVGCSRSPNPQPQPQAAAQAGKVEAAERLRAEEKARADKAAADRQARARALDAALKVSVQKLAYRKDDRSSGRPLSALTLDVALQNRSGKAIASVKGVLKLLDQSGALITRMPIALDGIGAGQTRVWSGERRYDPGDPAERQLARTALDKVKVEWSPSAIAFKDGQKATAVARN